MALTTLKIVDGELDFQDGSFTQISGSEAMAQRLRNRLLLYLAGWYLAPESGIDWPDILESKPVDTARISRILKQAIQGDEGVIEITSFSCTFSNGTRTLAIEFTADTDEGLVNVEVNV